MGVLEERAWMYNRLAPGRRGLTNEFLCGVETFINYVCARPQFTQNNESLRCPCVKCQCLKFLKVDEVKLHLYQKGFMAHYHYWTCHGEENPPMEPQTMKLGCSPTQAELFFAKNRRKDSLRFVDKRSKETYMQQNETSSQESISGPLKGSDNEQSLQPAIDEKKGGKRKGTFDVVSGKKNNRTYGMGSAAHVIPAQSSYQAPSSLSMDQIQQTIREVVRKALDPINQRLLVVEDKISRSSLLPRQNHSNH